MQNIDINKITNDGRYIDFSDPMNPIICKLSNEQIAKLRKYYKNKNIAKDVKILKLSREIKKGKIKRIRTDIIIAIVIGGIVVSVSAFFKQLSLGILDLKKANKFETEMNANVYLNENGDLNVESEKEKIIEESETELSLVDNMEKESELSLDDYPKIEEITEVPDESTMPDEIMQKRKDFVKKYASIYHLDEELVWQTFVNLTDNFTDSDYLNNYHINGVTCKGTEVYADNEEQLILYTIRCMKQAPDKLGISTNLYNDNGYTSNDDYSHQIAYFARLFGLDETLVYGIVVAETNFASDLFVNANNPAGLRLTDSWWHFETKEEGFIELCLEILKYNRKGAYTIEEIGSIHAPLSDGNQNWVPNVTNAKAYAEANREELFGTVEENKSLKNK